MSRPFFVFDGMDGAGKSTAIQALAAILREQGHAVLCTREPGGSPVAEEIRACLLKDHPMPVATELLLVFAARAAHLEQTIVPALRRGEIVLCDRFVDASHVYQGTIGGADHDWIEQLARRTVQCWPARSLIFDLPVELAIRRMEQRREGNRFDSVSKQRLEQVRQAYRQRVEAQPQSHCLIDASGTPDEIASQIQREILPWLN